MPSDAELQSAPTAADPPCELESAVPWEPHTPRGDRHWTKSGQRLPAAASEPSKDPELSGDDTSSTDASDGKGPALEGFYFDFDALPDEGPARPLADCPSRASGETAKEVAEAPSGTLPQECAEECAEDADGQAVSFISSISQLDFKETHGKAADATGIQLSSADYASQGCGFDFDDLPTLPSTLFEPRSDGAELASRDAQAKERLQGLGADVGHDVDDSPRSSTRASEAPTDGTRSSAASPASAGPGARALQPLPLQRRAFQSRPKVCLPGGRVAIVINGSVGDVAPLVALAQQLVLSQHTVRIFTTSNLSDFCAERGLDAVPMFSDSKAVIKSVGGYHKEWKECFSDSQTLLAEHRSEGNNLEGSLRSFRPQITVCGVLTFAACHMYEAKTGVPAIPVYLSYDQLVVYTEYANLTPPRPCILAVSPFVETRAFAGPSTCFRWTDEFVLHEVPSSMDFEPGGRLQDLCRFLVAGKPPVAMGWGSMVASGMTSVEMLGLALRALRGAGARGIIIGGWADLDALADDLLHCRLPELGEDAEELAEFAAADVFFVSSAPHEWLFPQCCSVVHHGGVGTWQAAIRAGRPSIVTPIFADQFSHSALVGRAGLGVGFKKALQEVEAHELANAIGLVEAKRSAAEAVGRKMRAKVGERDAANIIEDYLRRLDKAKEKEDAAKAKRTV